MGTPLSTTRLAHLLGEIAKRIPRNLVTDESAMSWEGNGEALAENLAFLGSTAPEPKKKARGGKNIITLPRSFRLNPAQFIGKGWSIDDEDVATAGLDRFDLSKVTFKTVLRSGEETVKGEEMVKRFQDKGDLLLGADHFLWYWQNPDRIPEAWKKMGAVYFPGTRLRNPYGHRDVLCLDWSDGLWRWDYDWLGDDWRAQNPSAVLEG